MAQVPNVIHFIWLSGDAPARPFSLSHYLAVRSAAEVHRPAQVWLWADSVPRSVWWDRARPYFRFRRVQAPRQIFGRPLVHPAHRADVLRLQLLLRYGGAYFDTDVLSVRPLGPLWTTDVVVLGAEDEERLCNAVIVSPPGASFLRRWLATYRTFRSRGADQYWGEHGVLMPYRLAAAFPAEIRVLDRRAFYWPHWREVHAFLTGPDHDVTRQSYCVHLWESFTGDWLRAARPEQLRLSSSEFARLARSYIRAYAPPLKCLGYGVARAAALGRRALHVAATNPWSLPGRILARAGFPSAAPLGGRRRPSEEG